MFIYVMVGLLLLFLVIGISQRGNKKRSRSSSNYSSPIYTDSSSSWRDDDRDDRHRFHDDNDSSHDSVSDSGSDSGGDSGGGDGGGGGE